MSGRRSAVVVHEFVDGYCVQCGESQEWVESREAEVER